ncbi:hypothetical protein KGA65_01390 [Ideonella sp. B7]|uniref:hypothetical protein n=1 Tax=Ideonella benzenivorans TaxID=2831643 RepID=UPI001CEC108A|nr:hypothetical protein [Ideonella benzenivorans]MCA6215183.1 hypothetical protein [Ideonella benzenivorans]
MQKSAQPPKSPARRQDSFEPLADKAHKSEPFWMAALGNARSHARLQKADQKR